MLTPSAPAVVTARLGAFRLGYLPADLRRHRGTYVRYTLDGAYVKVRRNSATIHDVINDTPDTCTLTIDAATPPQYGQRLRITINSDAPRLLFAGMLQTVDLSFELQPHQTVYPCQAIDDTPAANRRLPWGAWVNTSATTVAQWLIATFAPGYSAAGVQAGLDLVSVNFDSTEGMDGCLRQLAKLIGGYFYWEDRVLYLFTVESADLPDPIDAAHRFLLDPPITRSVDTSQLRTRVFGKGYAESIASDCVAGETIVPISNAVMFNPAGGKAVTETQRLTYTGTAMGGGGTLVGPGATPSAAPAASLSVGTGLGIGLYEYAVSFVTPAGESMVGPRQPITVPATMAGPGSYVTIGAQTGGVGPDAGTYQWGFTFVTPAGETTPSPVAGTTLTDIAHPIDPPVPSNNPDGFGYSGRVNIGDVLVFYQSFSAGVDYNDLASESTLSPPSAPFTIRESKYPGYYDNVQVILHHTSDARVKWLHLWYTRNGGPLLWAYGSYTPWPNNVLGFSYYTQLGSGYVDNPYPTPNPGAGGVPLQVDVGPSGTTARKIYRTWGSGAELRLIATLADNTTRNYTDRTKDVNLGAPAPTTGTAQTRMVILYGLPIGGTTVTGRKIYRTAAGGGPLKLLFTYADNTNTSYGDANPDAALGALAPTGDTSALKQPDGVVLAGSPSLIVAGPGAFPLGGGWVLGPGGQVIRYTAISGNNLTGIPAAGPGAITATINYNSTVTAAPALLGVAGLARAVIRGAPINLWIQRDNLDAQMTLAAIDHSDGIIEHLITDERRGETSLAQLCDADLEQYSAPIQTVTYATRDVKTKSGKPISVNLASPAIAATLTIQDVTITELDLAPGLNPRFTVSASSIRFSLEAILRRLGASLDVTS